LSAAQLLSPVVVSGLRRFGVFSLSATCVVSVSSVFSGSRRFGFFRFQWLTPFRFRLLSAACAVSVSVVSAAFAVSVLLCFGSDTLVPAALAIVPFVYRGDFL